MSVVEVAAPVKRTLGNKISRIIWDRDDKSDEERKWVRKLDLGLMTVICLGYFVKYLDQANVANAYVSGMKEDLDIVADEYNVLLTMFTVGYVVGQFPSTLIMVHVSPAIWLPACEILWSVLVMCCAAAKNIRSLYALRFLIGMLEAAAYPGGLIVLGSWYTKSELGKRAVLFISCSSAGTMFSGYLQTAVLRLDGHGGLQGWQWLFIIDGIISIPICAAGFFFIPNFPTRKNPLTPKWWLNDADYAIAAERMDRVKRVKPVGFSVNSFKSAFKCWVLWAFTLPYICFVVGLGSYAYFAIYLKSLKVVVHGKSVLEYTTAQFNLIPTGGYGLQIVAALAYSWTSDAIGLRWPVIAFAGTVALIGNIILSVWPAGESAKFAGFFLSYTVTGTGALMLSWAQELTGFSAETRAITVGWLNTMSYVFNAWVPNLVFPTSKAPHYPVGYKFTAACFAVFTLGAILIPFAARAWPTTPPVYEERSDAVEKGSVDDDDDEAKVAI